MNAATVQKDSKVVRKVVTNNYPTNRKPAVRLTEDEQYAVYKYCIENHCVYQIEAAIEFRVDASKIANEIIKNYPKIVDDKKISSYHVKAAVEAVVGWQKRIGKLPVLPMETAELEQLRIYKTKTMKELEEYKLAVAAQKEEKRLMNQEIERLKKAGAQSTIDQIRKLVGATVPTQS